MKFLFQGDSITDCGRDRTDPFSLGNGYVRDVAGAICANSVDSVIWNRGISGDRVRDLEVRWEEDCLALRPEVLTILIGVNDVWRQFDRGLELNLNDFCDHYRGILDRAKALAPSLILLEPFLIPASAEKAAFRPVLDPVIGVVRELAMESGANFVPLDGLFAAACCRQPPAYWAEDGIHPTAAGHRLIADAWLEAWRGIR